jgi:arylsulfatase A-like enzyme
MGVVNWKSSGVWALALTVLSSSCGTDGQAVAALDFTAGPPPNVVLISIDTLRADALHCYGNALPTSPNMDKLAQSGVLFEDPTAPTSWTLPSHLSMLTGLSISAHGVCDDRVFQGAKAEHFELPMRGTFLPEVLQQRGYETAGFYSWKYLEPEYGFGAGFDRYERVGRTVWSNPEKRAIYEAMRAEGRNDELKAWVAAEPSAFDDHAPTSHLVVDETIKWLEERNADPFFLFVHLFDAHNDYLPPKGFDQFDTDYQGPIDGSGVTARDSQVLPGMDPRDLEHLRALYLGEVSWVDHQVGRLTEQLRAQGLADNTLIVLTADHGEEFFEHGHKVHRTHLYRETVQVPLIMSWPGRLPAGKRVAEPVGLVDITPTVAEITNTGLPAAVSGRSLVPAMQGQSTPDVTYLTELLDFSQSETIPERLLGLRKGDKYWIQTTKPDGTVQLVLMDLMRDPQQASWGYPIEPDTKEWEDFRKLVDQERVFTQKERNSAAARSHLWQPPTSDAQAELASMGYVSGSGPVNLTHSDRLCLDGCVFARPSAPTDDPSSQ